jgi:3'-5' exoribonuclease
VAKAKPPTVPLSDLEPGQSGDFFALLAGRSKGVTRDNKPFYTCRFRDQKRSVNFMVWSDGKWFENCEKDWREGQFYKVRAAYGEHERYGPQIDIVNIRPATDADREEGFDPAALVEHARRDPEEMFAELRGLAEAHVGDVPLRRLTTSLLDRHAGPLKKLPATLNKFYPYPGGLLEHVLSVTRTCVRLMDEYALRYPDLKPPLNRDLVVAGAVLHDIGRVVELVPEGDVSAEPTVAGRLMGHLFLGRDLVRDAAREQGDVNPELLQLLEHLVVTHLTLPEWGSPRLPLIPEALILHHADDLDAKLEMYVRVLTKDQASGPFTDRDPVLNRQLFKGRQV